MNWIKSKLQKKEESKTPTTNLSIFNIETLFINRLRIIPFTELIIMEVSR